MEPILEEVLQRRSSRSSRVLSRSLSYSEAIGNDSRRSSIQIPSIINTDVYLNEELKKQYRISQTYVEGKEIVFPSLVSNTDDKENVKNTIEDVAATSESHWSSEDENVDQGLTLTIDVETESTPKSDRNFSNASTHPISSSNPPNSPDIYFEINNSSIYDRIEVNESQYDEFEMETLNLGGLSSSLHSMPYSKRKKKGVVHRQRHGRPMRSRRAVHKTGAENVPLRSNIPAKSIKYMRDVGNTIINSQWRFLLVMVVLAHFALWMIFAGLWYAVANAYADDIGDGRLHCVNGTSSFAGMLMMSVETQMTIGYGARFPNEECPEAIIIMVLEIVAGTALSGGLTSLLFLKLVRPNKHVSSVGFSKKATVCLRDGELVLQFRVWDLHNVHLIGSSITAYMLKPFRTLEGEIVNNYIHQLNLKQANAFLLWPITVVHVIDEQSPLYDFSAQDMMDYRFEIVVCLNGSAKNMGTITQSRTSYLSKEIIWGYRFKNVVKYSRKEEAYVIDLENLNTVEQVETPLCSANFLKSFQKDCKASQMMLATPPLSASATYGSLSQESSQYNSVASSPNLSRNWTQRSGGWKFRRFQPEKHVGNAVEIREKHE